MKRGEAEFADASVEAPSLPPQLAEHIGELDLTGSHEGVLATAPARVVSGPAGELRSSVLRGGDLTGASLRAWRATDVRIEAVNLANADLAGARLRRVRLERCRLTGVNLSGASLQHVSFMDCRGDLAACFDAELSACWFEGCDLREADFDGARLDRVAFRNCDLRGARLLRTDLRSTDVRGSRIDGLVVSPDRLSGLTIEPAQADVFAAALGLRVAPPPFPPTEVR